MANFFKNKKMKKILLLLSLITAKSMNAQEISIIPQPASMTVGKGQVTISPKNVIHLRCYIKLFELS